MRPSVFAGLSIVGLALGIGLVRSGLSGSKHACHDACVPVVDSEMLSSPLFKSAYKDYLAQYRNRQSQSAFTACFDSNTPPEVIAAHHQAMLALYPNLGGNERDYQGGGGWSFSTIPWCLVPDGDNFIADGPSNLVATLDAQFAPYGGRAKWMELVRACFARWSMNSGVRFYQVKDPDNDWKTATTETSGARIRLRGLTQDGPGNTLGYAYYPFEGLFDPEYAGDIYLDTSESWADPTDNFRFFRNVVMHEIGHAIGVAHSCPGDGTKLMEPKLTRSLPGVQYDDAMVAQFYYQGRFGGPLNYEGTPPEIDVFSVGDHFDSRDFIGDPAEPAGTELSDVAMGFTWQPGYYEELRFQVTSATTVRLKIDPVVRSYLEGPQNDDGTCSEGETLSNIGIGQFAVWYWHEDLRRTVVDTISPTVGTSFESVAHLPVEGVYAARVYRVEKGNTLPVAYNFELNFDRVVGNAQPQIVGPSDVWVKEGDLVSIQYSISDADNNGPYKWEMPANQSVGTISQSGKYTYQTSPNAGNREIRLNIYATDRGTPKLSGRKRLTIHVVDINHPPTFDPIPTFDVEAGTTVAKKLTTYDQDEYPKPDVVKTGGPSWVKISTTGDIEVSPPSDIAPWTEFEVPFLLIDRGEPRFEVPGSFKFRVRPVNSIPVFDPIPIQYVAKGQSLKLQFRAVDADEPFQTLVYKMVDGPPGSTFDPLTREYNFVPPTSLTKGTYAVKVNVTDGVAAVTQTVAIQYAFDVRGSVLLDETIRPATGTAGSLEIFEVTGEEVFRSQFLTNSAGLFAIPLSKPLFGQYNVRVDLPYALAKRKLVTFNITADSGSFALPIGDINDDSSIDLLDYFLLSDSYNLSQGQPGFNAQADLNKSGAVNAQDYSILVRHYGKVDE